MDYTFRDSWLDGFGGGVRYIGSSFADTANLLTVPSVVLGDLAVHYEWANNWRAAINVVNIADTPYVASCGFVTSCFYGDRRRVTGSLAYKLASSLSNPATQQERLRDFVPGPCSVVLEVTRNSIPQRSRNLDCGPELARSGKRDEPHVLALGINTFRGISRGAKPLQASMFKEGIHG